MADTTEGQLQVVLQEIGGNNNTWGTILNNNFQKLVDAIASRTSKAVTGASTSLTDDEQRSMVLRFTGTLTENHVVKVNDSAEKLWFVQNATSGNYILTVETDTGTGVAVEQGYSTVLFADGTNVVDLQRFLRREDLHNLKWVGEFGGTADALTITYNDFEAGALAEGLIIWGRVTAPNTGAATLNLNSIGATAIEDAAGNALNAAAWDTGQIIGLAYNATHASFQLLNLYDVFRQLTTPTLRGPLESNGNWIGKSKGSDLASATTLVVGTDGDIFDVTGTTEITGMTVAANRNFTLQFDGAVQLTVGASLILNNGGNNYTTEAGDIIEFYSPAANTVIGRITHAPGVGTAANQALKIGSDGKLPAMDASNLFNLPGTNIVQNIVNTSSNNGLTSNQVDITPLNTTITATADTVGIMVHFSVSYGGVSGGVFKLHRNGTELAARSSGKANQYIGTWPGGNDSQGTDLNHLSFTLFDDDPDVGDNEYVLSYEGQGTTFRLNRTDDDNATNDYEVAVSTVTLQEIR